MQDRMIGLSRLKSGSMLLADRGYDADWIRALAASRGALANIPPRYNRTEPICFSPYLYRARNLVERFFNKIKHCRRIATRYDKLAANYPQVPAYPKARITLIKRLNEFQPNVPTVAPNDLGISCSIGHQDSNLIGNFDIGCQLQMHSGS